MKKFKYLLLLLYFIILLSGCTKKEEVKQPISTSTPLLLEVTKEGTNNKLYLFGSIHVAEETMYPLPNYVIEAYKKSDIIAVEFDLIEYASDISNQLELASKFINTDGKVITDYLDETTYNNGVKILKNFGLYTSMFDNYNPIIWLSLIESATIADTDLKEEYGIDNYFLKQAKEDEKEILELESAEYQYNMLLGFDYDMQVSLLEQSINEYELAKNNMKQLYELYKKGNKEDLENVLFEKEEEPNSYEEEYNNQLITVRNQNMAKSLDENFEDGKNVFCTVGLAHIIGEGGIADLLEQKGYIIKIVK